MTDQPSEERQYEVFEAAIMQYNRWLDAGLVRDPLSADHHSGTCFVFFTGDEELCMKVKQFIVDEREATS